MDITSSDGLLIDQVPAIIFLINVDHHGIMRFEKTNQFFEKATGLANTFLKGKTPSEVFGEDIGRQMETVLHQCLETGESFKNELIMDLSDIKSVWLTSLYPIRENGKITKISGIATDITQRKRQEWRHEAIINSTHTGTWEWNVQTGEAIFNQRWAEIIGYTLEELEPIDIHTWEALAHPDDLNKSAHTLNRHFRGETDYYECECRMKHKDGHWVWVVDRGSVLEWTEDGKPLWMYGTHQDITERKHYEKQLGLFKNICDNALYGIAITNHKKQINYTNAYFAGVHGYTPEELVGKDISILHNDHQLRATKEIFDQLDQKGSFDPIEFWHQRKDGQSFPMLMSGVLYGETADFPEFYATSAIDISQQKAQQEEMERFFSVNLDLLCIADVEGRFLKVNKAWEETLGYSREELEHRKFLDFVHPDDLNTTLKTLETLQRQQKVLNFVNRYRHKDGHYRYIEWRSFPFENIIYAAARDITHHVETETQLKRQKEVIEKNRNTFQAIIKALPGLLLVVDEHYHVLLANKNKIQYSVENPKTDEEIIGQKCYQLFMERDTPCPWCKIKKVFETGQIISETTTPDDPREQLTGRAYTVLNAPVKDQEGHVIGAVEYSVDVTELRDAKLKAQAANKAKSEFLAAMSHELRTPLNGVIGFSEILKKTSLNEQQLEYLSIVLVSAKKLLEIISDILDFSLIENDKYRLHPERRDLREIAKKAIYLIRPAAKEKGLALSLSISEDTPEIVKVDLGRLEQILLNLLSNAVKFTQSGKVHLSVSTTKIQNRTVQLLFQVRDTGIGIKKSDQEIIFSAFQQADMSYTRKFGGTGLGLAICNDLLKKMGSTLRLESSLGKGSMLSFELTLPYGKCEKSHVEKKENSQEPFNPSLKNKKILIAEDDQINLDYAQKAISMFSGEIQVIRAKNGKEAYKFYLKHNPDLILMDLIMPEVDGYQATKMIRTHNQEVPIIAMTAKVLKADKEHSLSVGMNDFIPKPVSLSALKRILKKHL